MDEMDGIDRLHEIAEDVGRTVWLRDLGAALSETADAIEGGTRDISGYESDVLGWVEKNGGLEAVKERTMPDGMSWPFYEDGEPVRLGEHWQQDEYDWSITSIDSIEFAEDGVRFENEYADAFYRYGERVKRPAPPVLAADGVPIEVGDDLYSVEGMLKFHVSAIDKKSGRIATEAMFALDKWADPKMYTHRAPVLAADGTPLREGETVWDTKGNGPYIIKKIENDGVVRIDGSDLGYFGSEFVHERSDTWQRIEEDAGCTATKYNERRGTIFTTKQQVARDLVRRCRALAERERGE